MNVFISSATVLNGNAHVLVTFIPSHSDTVRKFEEEKNPLFA